MKQLFLHYNALFDVYNDYDGLNNIKTINDNAGIEPVSVDPEIIELLKTAKEFYDLSNGEFDVTMGAVLKIWHTYREEGIALNNEGQLGKVPPLAELESAKACTGWDKVEIDEIAGTVYLNQGCASLDVGGIAKGFAAGKVQQKLIEAGLVHGTVDAGGNICTINDKPGGQQWRVGHPQSIRQRLAGGRHAARLRGVCLQRRLRTFLRCRGRQALSSHHRPADAVSGDLLSIRSRSSRKNSGYADALSTALFHNEL